MLNRLFIGERLLENFLLPTGYNYGKLIDALEISGIDFIEVRPQKWKKHFGLSKDKKASVELASVLYPDNVYYGPKGGLKDGRAEAFLMAEYARQIH